MAKRGIDDLQLLEQLEEERITCSYQRLETVLVIEDHLDLNRSLALRLEHAGLNVAQAHDGVDGLDKIRSLEPDVIVLDLHLPRLHGFRLLERLRRQPNLEQAPIVVITGDPDPEVEQRAERWGIRRFFRKPVRQREVVESVLEILERYA